MKTLQDAIDQVLQDLPQQALATLIEKKLAAQGVRLSKREGETLTKKILEADGENTFHFQRWKWWDHQKVAIDFSTQDIEEIEQKVTAFSELQMPALIEAATEDVSRKVLADLKRKWSVESRLQRRQLSEFRNRLFARWKTPLEGLRMLVTISRELGDSINEETRQSSAASSNEHLSEVLGRSHARACQIMEEIICLLEGGFADGAMARWRTLHEVAVVAAFVAAHGEDLAERYVLHQAIESKRAAEDYKQCQERLGYEALSEKDQEELQRSYEEVIAQFGDNFKKGDYGWAGQHLGNTKPAFKDIERAVGVDHLRAHYRMASHNVHANPKGVFFKLGLLDESHLVFLAGPSNAGLTDPGQCAALSLAQTSTALVILQPTFENTVAIKIIVQLVHEIAEAFGQAHAILAQDDAAQRAALPK